MMNNAIWVWLVSSFFFTIGISPVLATDEPAWGRAGAATTVIAPRKSMWRFHSIPATVRNIGARLQKRFEAAVSLVKNEKANPDERVSAANLLAFAPLDLAGPALAEALTPTTPGNVQLAAARALAAQSDSKMPEVLLRNWKSYGPSLRIAVVDALLASPERNLALLEAIEKKQLLASELSAAQRQQLKLHSNASVKAKAANVFKAANDPERAKVVASYRPTLELKGNAGAGKLAFKQHCSACHKLDGVGHDVGPNLLATTGKKSGEELLVAIFDPNREVNPRSMSYIVGTADGQFRTGIIAAETPNSITIRRAEGAEDVILRANLELFRSTSMSLMPAGLENELKQQDVADILAYLGTAGK